MIILLYVQPLRINFWVLFDGDNDHSCSLLSGEHLILALKLWHISMFKPSQFWPRGAVCVDTHTHKHHEGPHMCTHKHGGMHKLNPQAFFSLKSLQFLLKFDDLLDFSIGLIYKD